MKFLADVNIPQSLIYALVNLGHDVLDAKKEHAKATDKELVALAKQEERIVITRDKDFLALVQFPRHQVATIAIRLTIQTPQHMKEHLLELLKHQEEAILVNALTIVREESADSYPYGH